MTRTPKPATLTLILSAAAVLGYLTYRITADRNAPGTATAARTPAELPGTLPDVTIGDLEGRPVSLGSWPGKPLMINFWATWCAPCLREIPLLKSFQKEHAEFQLVGIAVDRTEPVRDFAEQMQFNYPVLVGQLDGLSTASAFGVEVFALPFTVVTTPDGATLAIHTGELHAEHLDELAATMAMLQSGSITLAEARARAAGRR